MDSNIRTNRRACTFCRKRKLRCDRATQCGSCQKFGFECQYASATFDRIVKKAAKPSRVSRLEGRLGQIEQLLDSVSHIDKQCVTEPLLGSNSRRNNGSDDTANLDFTSIRMLEQAYFEFMNPVINILHQAKYQSSNSVPLYLQHVIWALGALNLDAYHDCAEKLYLSSRRKLEEAELEDTLLDRASLYQSQAFILIAFYELHRGYLHRAWMSIARAVTIAQVLKLHEMDVPQTVGLLGVLNKTGQDVIDQEERRRAFWQTFLLDRYNSVSTGAPTLIQERDIFTYLPASNKAFETGTEEPCWFLSEAIKIGGSLRLSTFSALVVMLSVSVANFQNMLRDDMESITGDLQDVSSKKTTILQKAMTTVYPIPTNLTLVTSPLSPDLAYMHVATYTATITLHRAAQSKNRDTYVSADIVCHSQMRCHEAASSILQILETIDSWDPRSCHMLHLFTIYSAFAVFASVSDSGISHEKALRFLLQKLESIKHRVRLAHVLLQDIDTEFPGLRQRLNSEDGKVSSRAHTSDAWGLSIYENSTNAVSEAQNSPELDFLFGDTTILNLDFLHSNTII